MVSREFEKWAEQMAGQPAPPAEETLDELRARIDRSMGGLPLAPGTTAEEITLGGVAAIRLDSDAAGDTSPIVVHLHGGGFRIASALSYRAFCSHLAHAISGTVIAVDYRLAPEHPFPAALQDSLAAHRALLDEGVPPERIVISGDSAGGGLAVSTILRLRDEGVALPAGVVAVSPWVDLTNTAASYEANATTDLMFSIESAREAASLYLGDHDPRDPHASPVFGDFAGVPPLLVRVSGAEVLLDDARALAGAAERADVEVDLGIVDAMPHIWPINHPAFPEATETLEEIAAFIRRVTGEGGDRDDRTS